MKRIVVTFVLACLVATVASANPRREIRDDFDLEGATEVLVDMKIGELVIEPSESGRVEVEIDLRCRNESPTCERQLERVEVFSERRSDRLQIGFDGLSKSSSRRMEVDARILVPADVDLSVEMGIGELDITGARRDVYVDLGIGEARLWLEESVVGAVYLDAGIGEAALSGASNVDSSRSFLIGAELEWDSEAGGSEVVVDLGIGEISVHLD